jgi:hypothetical protein
LTTLKNILTRRANHRHYSIITQFAGRGRELRLGKPPALRASPGAATR